MAIRTIRQAARLPTDRNAEQITETIVEEAVPEANAEIQRQKIDRLNSDQQFLYDIITEHGTIATGDLYEEYEKQADDPKSQRKVRNNLQKMELYELIKAEGKNRGRRYSTPV